MIVSVWACGTSGLSQQPLAQAALELDGLVAVAAADHGLVALDPPRFDPGSDVVDAARLRRGVNVASVGWWKSSSTSRPRSVAISARREDHEVIDAVMVASAPPG